MKTATSEIFACNCCLWNKLDKILLAECQNYICSLKKWHNEAFMKNTPLLLNLLKKEDTLMSSYTKRMKIKAKSSQCLVAMYPIETAENWKIPNLIWWINVKLAEMESLSIVKQNNPWNAHSIFEFSYFCCPECDSKLPVKQDFIDHASINHPWVSLRYSFWILLL